MEATPALYAKLDSLESAEPEIAKLKVPFGAVALMLQLGIKRFKGLEHADKVLGLGRSKILKDACGSDSSCRYLGNGYTVSSYGLFDPLSKHKGLPVLNGAGTVTIGTSFPSCISWFQGIGNILNNLIFDFFDYLSDFLDPDDPDCSNDPLEDCNNP